MNLPNKLTVSRIIMTPLFMAAMLFSKIPYNYTAALILFAVASFTDFLDGKIARKRGIVTNFGKFLDPVADKMLTTAALLGFIVILDNKSFAIQITVMAFLTLFREFAVASIRLIAVSSATKKVIPANIWGKLKTVFQMASIISGLLAYSVKEFIPLSDAVWDVMMYIFITISWLAAVTGIISGVIYLIESKEYLDSSK